MKKLIVFIAFLPFALIAQNPDMSIISVQNPSNASCNLTSSEIITVVFENLDIWNPYNGNFELSYSLNSGTIVSHSGNITFGGTLYTWTFPYTDDFSSCQVHALTVWIDTPGDTIPANDTIHVQITNDCAKAGLFNNDTTGCITNQDSVCQSGYTGTIIDWGASLDWGATWNFTGNATDCVDVSSLPYNSYVSVVLESQDSICPNDTAVTAVNCTLGIKESKIQLQIPSTVDQNSWNIQGLEKYTNNKLMIYDLNGRIVFTAQPYLNNWNSGNLENGIYLYQLTIENEVLSGKILIH